MVTSRDRANELETIDYTFFEQITVPVTLAAPCIEFKPLKWIRQESKTNQDFKSEVCNASC